MGEQMKASRREAAEATAAMDTRPLRIGDRVIACFHGKAFRGILVEYISGACVVNSDGERIVCGPWHLERDTDGYQSARLASIFSWAFRAFRLKRTAPKEA